MVVSVRASYGRLGLLGRGTSTTRVGVMTVTEGKPMVRLLVRVRARARLRARVRVMFSVSVRARVMVVSVRASCERLGLLGEGLALLGLLRLRLW